MELFHLTSQMDSNLDALMVIQQGQIAELKGIILNKQILHHYAQCGMENVHEMESDKGHSFLQVFEDILEELREM